MDIATDFSWLVTVLEILAVDVLLGSDNALMIALACRDLPAASRERAMMVGAVGAFVARVVLTVLASSLLGVPFLRLIGGLLLALIALNLARPPEEDSDSQLPASIRAVSVGAVIVTADLVMSLDNVVALAAVARGNYGMLALGLLLSIPALMYGATILMALLERHSWLIQAGAALLGWIAGDLAVSDSLYAGWIAVQSPALTLVVPALVAASVLLLSRQVAAEPRRAIRKPVARPAPLRVAAPPAPKPVQAPTVETQGEDDGQERWVMIAFLILFMIIALLLGSVLIFGDGMI
jgi:YjbE family integral membrane protein